MKLTLTLIRNGLTELDKGGVFIGLEDEPVTEEEGQKIRTNAKAGVYPPVQLVYTSALSRCLSTSGFIYPYVPAIVLKELAPFDYGSYTGKSYDQVAGEKDFQAWATAPYLTAIPGGEDPNQFQVRSSLALRNVATEMQEKEIERAAIVTHKRVIQSILQRFCIPRFYYGSWNIEGGGGYSLEYDTVALTARIRYKF